MTYRFKEPPAARGTGALPEGDYAFVVASCDEPYESKAGNQVLPVRLTIEPSGLTVFANPWAGTDKNGNERDGIADFLLAVNRAPKVGQEPDWKRVVGAKGTVHLRVKIAEMGALAGKEVNEVHYFYRPKEVGPRTAAEARTSFSRAEMEQIRKEAVKGAGGPTQEEPDDIPF
jgi:hypothetical protein